MVSKRELLGGGMYELFGINNIHTSIDNLGKHQGSPAQPKKVYSIPRNNPYETNLSK